MSHYLELVSFFKTKSCHIQKQYTHSVSIPMSQPPPQAPSLPSCNPTMKSVRRQRKRVARCCDKRAAAANPLPPPLMHPFLHIS
jgi:hypothetical protein